MIKALKNWFANRKKLIEHRKYLKKVVSKAKEGDKASLYELGMFYENGVGVKRNLEKASQYYLEAANKGMIAACRKLGSWCDEGIAGHRDVEQALHWFRYCAQGNNLDDVFKFAMLCVEYKGKLSDKDIKIARGILEEMAEEKHPKAMYGLAVLCERNIAEGGPERVDSLMRISAFKGCVEAQLWMGDQTAKHDVAEAKHWYEISAINGCKEALARLEQFKEIS